MTRIAIALTQDFADWEPALLAAAARSYLGVEIVTASPDGQPVTSMGGFKVMPEASYDALDPETIDALVIPGGLSWEKGQAPDFSDLVHRFRRKGRVVAGICAAASALAGTGILNSVAHTGNALSRSAASRQRSGCCYSARQFTGQLRERSAESSRSVGTGSRSGSVGIFCGTLAGLTIQDTAAARRSLRAFRCHGSAKIAAIDMEAALEGDTQPLDLVGGRREKCFAVCQEVSATGFFCQRIIYQNLESKTVHGAWRAMTGNGKTQAIEFSAPIDCVLLCHIFTLQRRSA